jgi:hypothetical protein
LSLSKKSLVSVAPSAARLTTSLRDIGYEFPSAVADLVDNSIAAEASRVEIIIRSDGADSLVMIADDGHGMTQNGLTEALRFGSRRAYRSGDLGRYGLGLKTASLSQCRSVTVVSRRVGQKTAHARQMDLDVIVEFDDWLITTPTRDKAVDHARGLLDGSGTVVIWRNLDRILLDRPDGGWAKRRVDALGPKVAEHLSLVFHRFLERDKDSGGVTLIVNGEKLQPWNPFAVSEEQTQAWAPQEFEVDTAGGSGKVRLTRYVLPSKDAFSSHGEFERMSGPRKWNRQQGLYIYRADRLVQWGGWAGMRSMDEHMKLARAALDFGTDLDVAFNINVAKMRAAVPPQLRLMLERPIHELCMAADERYRSAAKAGGRDRGTTAGPSGQGDVAVALRAAAMQAGEFPALKRIVEALRRTNPQVAQALGLAE